ncbi:MAG: rhomboid family intramembrane serine protease [Nitrospirae bacterium]|nr:rhomboid family intramembrane serine protease [Nitrospirota bacterium]
MFIPVGDTPNPPGRPVVNYLLMAVNVLVFAVVTLPLSFAHPDPRDPAFMAYVRSIPELSQLPLQMLLREVSAYDVFLFRNAFKPGDFGFSPLMLSMFLHGGWMHLIGNMMFLWIFGDNVEHRLGRMRYLVAYLASGIAASLVYAMFSLGSMVPMVGASGAISGVLGLYYIWFPGNRVKIFMMLFPFFMDVVLVPARFVLGFYIIAENLLPFLLAPRMGGGGVAYGAHIGGFMAGLAIAWALDRLPGETAGASNESREGGDDHVRRAEKTGQARVSSLSSLISGAVSAGDAAQAAKLYFSDASGLITREANADDLMKIGDYLLKERRFDEALTLFRRYIAAYPRGPYLDWASLGAGIAILHGRGQTSAAYQYFLQVLDVNPSERARIEAVRQIQAIERNGSDG